MNLIESMRLPLTIGNVKRQAHKLKECLKEKGYEVKLGHCYEAIAQIYSFPNWDTMIGTLKNAGIEKE